MNKVELAKIKQKALEDHIPIIMDDTLEVIEKELKVPTKMADSPLTCVAEGTGIILDNLV